MIQDMINYKANSNDTRGTESISFLVKPKTQKKREKRRKEDRKRIHTVFL